MGKKREQKCKKEAAVENIYVCLLSFFHLYLIHLDKATMIGRSKGEKEKIQGKV